TTLFRSDEVAARVLDHPPGARPAGEPLVVHPFDAGPALELLAVGGILGEPGEADQVGAALADRILARVLGQRRNAADAQRHDLVGDVAFDAAPQVDELALAVGQALLERPWRHPEQTTAFGELRRARLQVPRHREDGAHRPAGRE